ncbi:CidA/LrgA family protein [Paenibacillus hamazuiensis]|uniref:CidA/LrgA family protein n=1 Tax=Paenibacillus hamazuiensis TaxID=2936508 RepID=UPI00200C9BED|nr:CidA/LrgA family protein [Paenibacillus hamazuiensis]
MLGFAILIGFHMIGMLLQYGLHVPLPAGVIGLTLFTFSLFLKLVKLEWVEETAVFLNKHMLLFFCPIVVGSIVFVPFIRENAVPILGAFFGSWLAVTLASGWTAKLLGRSGDADRRTTARSKETSLEPRVTFSEGVNGR